MCWRRTCDAVMLVVLFTGYRIMCRCRPTRRWPRGRRTMAVSESIFPRVLDVYIPSSSTILSHIHTAPRLPGVCGSATQPPPTTNVRRDQSIDRSICRIELVRYVLCAQFFDDRCFINRRPRTYNMIFCLDLFRNDGCFFCSFRSHQQRYSFSVLVSFIGLILSLFHHAQAAGNNPSPTTVVVNSTPHRNVFVNVFKSTVSVFLCLLRSRPM